MVVIGEVFDSENVLARFSLRPARTEDECNELLKAVFQKYAHDDESKWVRMTESFNARASESKSKQWMKRAIGKLDTADIIGTPYIAGAVEPTKLTKAQRKKQEHEDRLKIEAAKAVANEMPEGDDEKARFMSKKMAEHFWESLSAGELPEAEVEGIFGCKTKDDAGEAAYGAWGLLIQRKRITVQEIADSLSNGSLPVSFGQWLQDIPPREHCPDSLKLVTKPEVFSKIPWDVSKMKRCALPDMEVAVTMSAAAGLSAPKLSPSAAADAESSLANDPGAQDLLQKLAAQLGGAGPQPGVTGGGGSKSAGLGVSAPGKSPNITDADIDDLRRRLAQANVSGGGGTATTGGAGGGGSGQAGAAQVQGGSGDGYEWIQQTDEVEVTIPVGSVARKDVKVNFKSKELCMESPKKMRLLLHSPVNLDGCGWTLSEGKVVVTLEKKEAGKNWPALLKP